MMSIGVDVSGMPGTGNYKFMAVVMGTEEGIAGIVRDMGCDDAGQDPARIKKHRSAFASMIRFDGRESSALCVRIDREDVVNGAKQMRRIRHRNIPNQRLFRAYHYILWNKMQERITEFLNRHGHALPDVVFQCDSDCRSFILENGLRCTDGRDAHMLADLVAWSNNRGREPEGVVSVNLADEIRAEMRKKFS